MNLRPAAETELDDLVDLINQAYRHTGTTASWNAESGIFEGLRITRALLQQDLDAKPDAYFLVHRPPEKRNPGLRLAGACGRRHVVSRTLCHPAQLQAQHLGRSLLAAAEAFVLAHGGRRIRMSVLSVRRSLIAWYERRGYARAGKTEPFPYGDDRYGIPLRDDLYFEILRRAICE